MSESRSGFVTVRDRRARGRPAAARPTKTRPNTLQGPDAVFSLLAQIGDDHPDSTPQEDAPELAAETEDTVQPQAPLLPGSAFVSAVARAQPAKRRQEVKVSRAESFATDLRDYAATGPGLRKLVDWITTQLDERFPCRSMRLPPSWAERFHLPRDKYPPAAIQAVTAQVQAKLQAQCSLDEAAEYCRRWVYLSGRYGSDYLANPAAALIVSTFIRHDPELLDVLMLDYRDDIGCHSVKELPVVRAVLWMLGQDPVHGSALLAHQIRREAGLGELPAQGAPSPVFMTTISALRMMVDIVVETQTEMPADLAAELPGLAEAPVLLPPQYQTLVEDVYRVLAALPVSDETLPVFIRAAVDEYDSCFELASQLLRAAAVSPADAEIAAQTALARVSKVALALINNEPHAEREAGPAESECSHYIEAAGELAADIFDLLVEKGAEMPQLFDLMSPNLVTPLALVIFRASPARLAEMRPLLPHLKRVRRRTKCRRDKKLLAEVCKRIAQGPDSAVPVGPVLTSLRLMAVLFVSAVALASAYINFSAALK